jgi:hypothetical protein
MNCANCGHKINKRTTTQNGQAFQYHVHARGGTYCKEAKEPGQPSSNYINRCGCHEAEAEKEGN